MKKILFIIGAFFVFLIALFVLGDKTKMYVQTAPPFVGFGSFEKNYVGVDEISYKGEEGKDALRLLKEKAKVGEAGEGFVASINERWADKNKREYWAFYVNGKPATVGAGSYITKDTDIIIWKIEKY